MTSPKTQKKKTDIKSLLAEMEPNWLTGYLGNYTQDTPVPDRKGVYQQSDLLKPMLDDVVQFGLNYTYHKYKGAKLPIAPEVKLMAKPSTDYKYSKTSKSRHVIIVGAGLAGLSAAYELTKAGHEVDILEMQNRVGGRVKTLREKDGFSKHCHVEAGAMRLPNLYDAKDKTHYLTDYYASTEFGLKLGPFSNYDKNAWLKFYDKEKIRISDWKKDSKKHCDEFWEGWDKRFRSNSRVKVDDIDDYYAQTVAVVTEQLKRKLDSIKDEKGKEEKMAKVWDKWIKNWSNFSLISFLQNTKNGVQQLLDKDHKLDPNAASTLDALIPWPDVAVKAYSVYSYTEQLDQCLVQYLRDELGNWWSEDMHRIVEGTYKLPQAFVKERKSPWPKDPRKFNLKEKVTFHISVDEIAYAAEDHEDFQNQKVIVRGKYVSSGRPFEITGDAIIITVPLHIIRQIRFVPANDKTKPAATLTEIYKSLEDIWQGPATKLMLQYKERFWERKPDDIHGGFSKTSLPIGQLHYPTVDSDTKTKRGILLCYTWKSEALMFGALQPHDAIHEAVSQIAQIHPGSEEYFEVGAVQAWTNKPYAQGAYALLKPHQYVNVRNLMIKPCLNMFFAGDGISFAAGWMQGALESGLRAAYQFYCRNESTASS